MSCGNTTARYIRAPASPPKNGLTHINKQALPTAFRQVRSPYPFLASESATKLLTGTLLKFRLLVSPSQAIIASAPKRTSGGFEHPYKVVWRGGTGNGRRFSNEMGQRIAHVLARDVPCAAIVLAHIDRCQSIVGLLSEQPERIVVSEECGIANKRQVGMLLTSDFWQAIPAKTLVPVKSMSRFQTMGLPFWVCPTTMICSMRLSVRETLTVPARF